MEAWADKAAHDFHMAQKYTQAFVAFHEQFHRKMTFETINPESS
ncbi:hypothetical protein ACMV_P1_01330 (plasmid) [Acidiphilium multivorum AIU301]|uniref:ABM domain-containing protein n=1 Tax=Acidiphilium multivorum (strain DSM 11245 / JCM 8867 / NBRC 100883 / AIU 301) TaxID=926570 RepID=F0J762_ACIMA|nr:hypothetical protein ACMV_P1_01330 [Acidiphilium multivorum AIU301]